MTINTSKEVHQSDADLFCIRIPEHRKFRVHTDDGKDHVFENANDAIRFAIENNIFPLGVTMDAIMSAVLEGDAIKRLTAEHDAQTNRADVAEAEVARLKKALVHMTAERDTSLNTASVWEAELSVLRAGQDALVAAAYDAAASMIEDNMRHAAELGLEIWPIPDIRALTPSDATAALDTKLRAERNKALRDAADRTLGLATGHECRTAILAMIEPEGK